MDWTDRSHEQVFWWPDDDGLWSICPVNAFLSGAALASRDYFRRSAV